MKNNFKLIALALSVISVSSLFTGCGTDNGEVDTSSKEYIDGYEAGHEKGQEFYDETHKSDNNNNFAAGIKKPIIYIYPEKETEVQVDLTLNKGELTCVYPTNDTLSENSINWNVTAYPDGTLKDKDTGLELYSLYWEGTNKYTVDFSTGYCIKGKDTAEFLNTTLRKLGLSAKEAEEFIIYWLPELEQNKYNLISFDTSSYIENAELNITPTPDNLIRVFMTYKPVDTFIDIPEQDLGETPSRDGYTVVEWGGAEVK